MKKGISIVLIATIGALMAGCTMHKNTENHEDMSMTTGVKDSAHSPMKMEPITSEFQFLSEMIPHHEEAIRTSLIVNQNTANTTLRNITAQIATAQTQEVEVMKLWVKQLYSGSVYTGKYENMMPSIVGAIGEMRDRAYIQGMISHHIGAVVMAQQVLKLEGLHAGIKTFAENVVKVQSKEIETLTQLLIDYK